MPLLTAAEIIENYKISLTRDDHATSARHLVGLENPEFLNEADWEVIQEFLLAGNFDARLEIITKNLIRAGQAKTVKPYFVVVPLIVKSGRIAEASALLRDCRAIFGDVPAFRWQYVNLLFETGNFQDCLDEARLRREELPDHVGYAVMEVRALWSLEQRLAARAKLKELAKHIGPDPGDWQWYLYIALEIKEPVLADLAHDRIIQLIESGTAPITPSLILGFNHAGLKATIPRMIRTADPKNYATIAQLQDMFEVARHYGDTRVAQAFGKAILAEDPANKLRGEIEKLLRGHGFLMA